jgi:hypothetical protein
MFTKLLRGPIIVLSVLKVKTTPRGHPPGGDLMRQLFTALYGLSVLLLLGCSSAGDTTHKSSDLGAISDLEAPSDLEASSDLKTPLDLASDMGPLSPWGPGLSSSWLVRR